MKDGKISVVVSTALKSSCPDVNQNYVTVYEIVPKQTRREDKRIKSM